MKNVSYTELLPNCLLFICLSEHNAQLSSGVTFSESRDNQVQALRVHVCTHIVNRNYNTSIYTFVLFSTPSATLPLLYLQ
jgi:hypothetical protein